MPIPKKKLDQIFQDPDFHALNDDQKDIFLSNIEKREGPKENLLFKTLKTTGQAILNPTPIQVAQSGMDRFGGALNAGANELYGGLKEKLLEEPIFKNVREPLPSTPISNKPLMPAFLKNVLPGMQAIDIYAQNTSPKEAVKQGQSGLIDLGASLATEGVGPIAKKASDITHKISSGLESNAGRVMNQYLKPREAQFAFGKNPGLEIAKQGIKAWSRKDLSEKVNRRLNELGTELENHVINYEKAGVKVDMTDALKTIISKLKDLEKLPETTAQMQEDLRAFGRDLLNLTGKDYANVSPTKALEIKRLVGKIPSWAIKDPKLGTKSDVSRAVYTAIDKAMDKAIPETADLNSSISNLLGGKTALKVGRAREENKSFIGLFDRLGPGGIGGAIGLGSGGLTGAGIGAAAGIGASKIASSAFGRTRIANALARLSEGSGEASEIFAKLKSPKIFNSLIEAISTPETSLSVVPKKYSTDKINLLTRKRASEISKQLPDAVSTLNPIINAEGSSTLEIPQVLESDLIKLVEKYGIPTYGNPRSRTSEFPKIGKGLSKEVLDILKRRFKNFGK